MLRPVVFRTFFGEVGHLPFDHPGVDPVVPKGQEPAGDVGDHSRVEGWQPCGGRGAKERGGFPQDPHGVNETQSPGIDVHGQSGFVHEEPHGVVAQQDAVDFLENAARCATPKTFR